MGKRKHVAGKSVDNVYKAHCTVCRCTFSVAHGGLFDVKQHASSGRHIKNVRDNQVDP